MPGGYIQMFSNWWRICIYNNKVAGVANDKIETMTGQIENINNKIQIMTEKIKTMTDKIETMAD